MFVRLSNMWRFQTFLLGVVTVLLAVFVFLPDELVGDLNCSGKTPIEVGNVRWGRDYATALKTSKSTGKPLLVLFQEVPG